MKNIIKNNSSFSLAVLSGILSFLAFPPFGYSFLGWVCLIPLFFAVRNVSRRDSFLLGFTAGLVFFGGVLCWLVNVTVPGTMILVLILSVFFGVFALAIHFFNKYSFDLLILPFLWVVLEYIRSNIFTGFPWALLAHSQYKNIPMIQVADVMGAYGISFVMVLFNVAIFAFIARLKRRKTYMFAALFLVVLTSVYGFSLIEKYKTFSDVKLSVVQGNIPQREKWSESYAGSIIDQYTGLTLGASEDRPSMIIWPETSYPYLVRDYVPQDISKLAKEIKIPILAGVVYDDNGNLFNTATLVDAEGNVVDRYKKLHLVPFGEYIPLDNKLSFLRNIIHKEVGNYKKGKEVTVFPLKALEISETEDGSTKRTLTFLKFSVLICFEDIFPYVARNFVKNGALFLVNMTNDAWFGDNAASEQHLTSSVFRAIENRVPVIRAANTGVSCFIDSMGNITSRVNIGGKDTFISGIDTDIAKISYRKTFYTKYGDVFVYFSAFMLLLLLATEILMTVKGQNQQK